MSMHIRFNKPFKTGNELSYINEALEAGHLAGDGEFTTRCHDWLQHHSGCAKALLTHSCTAALEMSAMLLDLDDGDEVIMPSYTFVSTANAFALRGAVPVFVDIREDTLNLDETLIEDAITPRTKAIVPVHYAGVACEMRPIVEIAKKNKLRVIEDAAQAVGCSYNDRPLGSIGDLGCYSFHETKNIISGEGGALLINDSDLVERAEIIREKGTNRSQFFRGHVDKYTWVDTGSSYLPGEIIAAFLWAQMENAEFIRERRLALWHRYHDEFSDLERAGYLRRPIVPQACDHNAHMYYILLDDAEQRTKMMTHLSNRGIDSVFHYVPLHSSSAGQVLGRKSGNLAITNSVSDRLLRLPMWCGLEEYQDQVIEAVYDFWR